jgi:hypothetical protein
MHDLQAAARDIGDPGRSDTRRRRTVQPAAAAVEDLAHQLTSDADTAQVQPQLRAAEVRAAQLRAGVQRVRRELASHQHGIIEGLGLEPQLRDTILEQPSRYSRARFVGGQHPCAT